MTTGAMEPTISMGEKLSYSSVKRIQRGDVIVFKMPDDENRINVKRVISLPGETIEIIDGAVYSGTIRNRF